MLLLELFLLSSFRKKNSFKQKHIYNFVEKKDSGRSITHSASAATALQELKILCLVSLCPYGQDSPGGVCDPWILHHLLRPDVEMTVWEGGWSPRPEPTPTETASITPSRSSSAASEMWAFRSVEKKCCHLLEWEKKRSYFPVSSILTMSTYNSSLYILSCVNTIVILMLWKISHTCVTDGRCTCLSCWQASLQLL